MTIDIDALSLPVRVRNALKEAGVLTRDDLLKQTVQDLLRVPNLGRKGVAEILVVLGIRANELTLGEMLERERK